MTILLDIPAKGTLQYLLSAFLGAYNRRSDIMERAVRVDERIRAQIEKLDTAGEALKETVENNQPNIGE